MSTEVKIPGTAVKAVDVHYWNIIDGHFAKRVDKGTPGARERMNKNGEVVYEVLVNELSGVIDEVRVKDTQYGVQLVLALKYTGEDGSATHVINIPQGSSAFTTVCNRILSADLNEPIVIGVFKKEKTIVYLRQKDELLPPKLFEFKDGRYVQLDKRVKPLPANFDSLPTDKKALISLERKTAMTDIIIEFGRKIAEMKGQIEPMVEANTEETTDVQMEIDDLLSFFDKQPNKK